MRPFATLWPGLQSAGCGGSGASLWRDIFSGLTAIQTGVSTWPGVACGNVDGMSEFGTGDDRFCRAIVRELAFEDVHRADEVGDEAGGWELIQVGRRAELSNRALVHDGDAGCDGESLVP